MKCSIKRKGNSSLIGFFAETKEEKKVVKKLARQDVLPNSENAIYSWNHDLVSLRIPHGYRLGLVKIK